MHDEVRALFHALSGLPPEQREEEYRRGNVSAQVRSEVESLLRFDQGEEEPITALVGAAAADFFLREPVVQAGERYGPFRLATLLGNGGMGAVYLAERVDGEVDQKVAIKFLRAGVDTPYFRERFLRERQILASLSHPGITRLLDAGHSGGQPYLVMEFVDGTRIDEFVIGLDTRRILELMIDVASAVSYAHRNLVVHCDIKPSNILIDRAGRPKLLDFGIARMLDSSEETQTIERIMTPEYASPEQLLGERGATAADIYSLGAVLYRLLTGRSPREGERPPAGLLPKELAAVIGKAMRQNREQRYASVDLLIADLEAFLEHRPVAALRASPLYTARKFARRHWFALAALALALVGVSAGWWLAEQGRDLAQRRFGQVRLLSKELLELDRDIRTLPGATKARARIVSVSLNYLERLGTETPGRRWRLFARDEGELTYEIASAYLQVARVQGVPGHPNLGQIAKAKESLIKAEQLLGGLLEQRSFSSRPEILLAAAEVANDSMVVAMNSERKAGALKFAEQTAARLAALRGLSGTGNADAPAMARIYTNLALTHQNLHRLEEATRFAEAAVELCRADPANRPLTQSLGVLANTSRFAGDFDKALAAIREARALAEQLADADNHNRTIALVGALWREGLILGELNNISLGRPDQALPLLRNAYALSKELARRDAHDYTSRSYASMAGRELGDVLRDSDPAAALAVYEETRQILAEVQGHPKARLDEVWLLTGSSYALRRLSRIEEAARRVKEAFAVLEAQKLHPADNVELGEEPDAALRALADHYAATGNSEGAIQVYEELHAKVLASNPQPLTDLRHANGLSRIYRDLGALYRITNRQDRAADLGAQRLRLWDYWSTRLPRNPFVQHQLAQAQQDRRAR
jgi:tRNA A-37 threonylcarbamoyl transferase component Bud32/tetratricopeptide (TPR) repeat protein